MHVRARKHTIKKEHVILKWSWQTFDRYRVVWRHVGKPRSLVCIQSLKIQIEHGFSQLPLASLFKHIKYRKFAIQHAWISGSSTKSCEISKSSNVGFKYCLHLTSHFRSWWRCSEQVLSWKVETENINMETAIFKFLTIARKFYNFFRISTDFQQNSARMSTLKQISIFTYASAAF